MLNKISIGAALAALLLLGCDLTGQTAQTTEAPTLTVDQELGESIAGILPGETRMVRVESLGAELATYVRDTLSARGLPVPDSILMAVEESAPDSRGSIGPCRSTSIGCGHSTGCSGSTYVINASKVMTPIGPCTHHDYKYLAPTKHVLYGCTDPDCGYFRDEARQYHLKKY